MKFAMAMVALEQGKKVRLSTWIDGDYIYIKDNYVYDNRHCKYDIPSSVPMHSSWELYTESVKLNTLKDGDSFIYNNKQYIILPLYLKKYCGNMTGDSIPIMSVDSSCFTSLFGNVVVRKA